MKKNLEKFKKFVMHELFIGLLTDKVNKKLDFEKYCLKNNYAPNTISKDLRTLKTVCNHAKYNGIKTVTPL